MMIETVTIWLRPTRSQPPAHVTTVVNARLYNRLHHLGVETVTDLLRMTEDDLLDMRNVGVKTVRDTQSELQRQGLPASSRQGKRKRSCRISRHHLLLLEQPVPFSARRSVPADLA